MNHYTQLLLFLKALAETHPLVSTVTHGNADNIDLEKANIFPLVHLTIADAKFNNGKTLVFPITIECLSERDFNKEIVEDKFWRQDNEVDNHNETLAILNYMWTYIYRDWNQDNLTTEENATAEKIEFAKGNVLDGWSLSFEVEVPNTDLCLAIVNPVTYEVDFSSSAGGSVISTLGGEGTYTVNDNETEAFCAEAEEGFAFDSWTGTSLTSNIITLKINKAYTLVANFIASGLTLFMQIFDSIPVQRGLSWFFGDHSTKDNDVEVGSVMSGTLTSSSQVSTGFKIQGQVPFNFKGVFIPNNIATNKYLFYSKNTGASQKGTTLLLSNHTLFYYIADGTNQQVINLGGFQDEMVNDIEIDWNGLIGGTITVTLNDIIQTHTALYEWVGDSLVDFSIGKVGGGFQGQIAKASVTNYFDYILNHGQLDKIRNLLDPTGATDGTITGAVLSTFWGSTADNIEPYDSTLGATLYKNDGDDSIMPICANVSYLITGFTRLGYFPAGSGALKGLPNKYYISGVDSIIAEGWYTIEELIAYEGVNVEVTQDATAVTLFKVSI